MMPPPSPRRQEAAGAGACYGDPTRAIKVFSNEVALVRVKKMQSNKNLELWR
jgi:hypothetical protein